MILLIYRSLFECYCVVFGAFKLFLFNRCGLIAGYLYNFQTKELYDLTYPQEFIGTPFRFEGLKIDLVLQVDFFCIIIPSIGVQFLFL
jgi:hypothetical protein